MIGSGIGRLAALAAGWIAALLATSLALAQTPPAEFRPLRAEYEQFMSQMHERHGFDLPQLHLLFSKLQPNAGVIKAITTPSTAKPWYEFRSLFLDDWRVTNGARFWSDHADALARARRDFGVPEAIIVAIIGVETRYGRNTGSFRVAEALATLAFDVPGRQDYFQRELEYFLLLAREQGWDPWTTKGSYAGAMGMPQFMPSSYRRHAVDFNGNGKINLWSEPEDVIGSVASFLRNSGWREGSPVALPARVDGVDPKPLLEPGVKPTASLTDWAQRGAQPTVAADGALLASVFTLDQPTGPEYWFGLENFYALIQYNRSRNYAMAVYQLAQQIERVRSSEAQ